MQETKHSLQLSTLYIYPIKSLAGIPLTQAQPGPKGLPYDRQWMLTTPDGRFVSQRTLPSMALLQPALQEEDLIVWDRRDPKKRIRIEAQPPTGAPECMVSIWEDTVPARVYPSEINEWFTARLKLPVQLVWMPPQTRRPVDPEYAQPDDVVSFADGFPYLIATQSSLDDLNRRLQVPVTMERFRPNLVLSGEWPAWDEDAWASFQIGSWRFRSTKPCGRCEVVTIDPSTAQRSAEPLRTLAGFRQKGHSIRFGLNACLATEDTPAGQPLLTTGMPVRLLHKHT